MPSVIVMSGPLKSDRGTTEKAGCRGVELEGGAWGGYTIRYYNFGNAFFVFRLKLLRCTVMNVSVYK